MSHLGDPVGRRETVGGSSEAPLIAVLDYGIGNLRSAEKALQHVGADARLTDDPELVARAAAVVMPGVGAFGACRAALARTGMEQVARDAIASGRPFLGVCVGMQLLFEGSEEAPGVDGLGVLPGLVRRLPAGVRHPQMQWNTLELLAEHPVFDGLPDPAWMYFVHSYAAEVGPTTVAACRYGSPVAAAAATGNVIATQFHPEKSGDLGLALLANFVRMAAS